MTEAEELAATLPSIGRSLHTEALDLWLQREGVTMTELRDHTRRSAYIVQARRIAARFLREHGWSYPQIARHLGYPDHTGAYYLCSDPRRDPSPQLPRRKAS